MHAHGVEGPKRKNVANMHPSDTVISRSPRLMDESRSR